MIKQITTAELQSLKGAATGKLVSFSNAVGPVLGAVVSRLHLYTDHHAKERPIRQKAALDIDL